MSEERPPIEDAVDLPDAPEPVEQQHHAARPAAPPPPPPELPPLEDITFTPPGMEPDPVTAEIPTIAPERVAGAIDPVIRGEDRSARPPAPAMPRAPGYVPRALSGRRFATLRAFADALLPGGAGPSGSEASVARAIDTWLSDVDDATRTAFERALATLEWSPLLGRGLRRLTHLKRDGAIAAVARARTSRIPIRRDAAATVADAVLDQWAAAPAVEQRLGFDYACVENTQPREAASLEVLAFPQVHGEHVEACDVVVIGSGPGGSVVAAELAERGLSVVVLEEGLLHQRDDLGGAPVDRARRLYRGAGAMRARGTPGAQLALGMGVGGSSLVGYGSAFRAPDEVLLRWEKEFGIPEMDATAMRPWFDRIERSVRVQPVPQDLLGPMVPRLREAGRKLGVHGGVVRRMIDGCRGCGTCSAGCPSDAKLGMHLSELPRAQRHGAAIYAGARAHRIIIEGGRARGVEADMLDPRTRRPRARLRVEAPVVVLAAGAIHTPALLLDNALGNRSGLVGRGLSLQPTATVWGFFEDPLHSWRGTQQPFAFDEWLDAHGIMLEVTSAVPSLDAAGLPGAGGGLMRRLDRFGHAATLRVSVRDEGASTVARARDGAEPRVRARFDEATEARLARGIAEAAELFLAAGAREVLTGLSRDAVTTEAQAGDLASAAVPSWMRLRSLAPSGGARMGPDPASSVVDPRGAVHGVGGVWVADASVLPSCLGVPPQLTIMALAARAAEHIARGDGSP